MATATSATLIQRARDIAADTFLAISEAGAKPKSFGTFAAWGEHIDSYAGFMRGGAYDDDLAVQAALAALASVEAPELREAA